MWLEDRFLTWWLHGARYTWLRLRRRLFEGGFLSTLLPAVNSLDDIQSRLKEVAWKKDWLPQLFDCVSYPQRVWSRKKDDCDGFAILAAALLSGWAPETNPVMVTAMIAPLKNSHSVCVFKQGENLRYFSNDTLKPGNFQSYQAIVADFATHPNRLICWDVVQPDTLATLEFHVV